jgi:ABC-type nitrate/sulfonate/bicarbonate transport system permease component
MADQSQAPTRTRSRLASHRWAIGLVLFVVLWQAATWLLPIPAYVLPSPTVTVRAILNDLSFLGPHVGMTVLAASTGFALAVLLGLLFGMAMNASVLARDLLYPPLVLSQAIPLIAIAPLILIWFGFGVLAKMLIVAFVCFFPISVSAYEGFRAVNPAYRELLETYGATTRDRYRHLYVPAALPSIVAGAKIAATYSVLGAVIGEWLGGSKGMGVYMTRALSSVRVDRLFGAILIVMLLSYGLFKSVDVIGRAATPWMRRRNA